MPTIDKFESHAPSETGPVTDAVAVSPSDTVDLAYMTRALHIGTPGDLRVDTADGSTVTFVNIAAGWHPVRVTRIWATGTTAADIIGCW